MRIHRFMTFALVGVLVITGCAFSRMGPSALKEGRAAVPEGLTPLQAVEQYGVPDLAYTADGRTYWVYQRQKGFFINLYYFSLGSVVKKDLQLEFEDGKLVKVDDYPSGNAFGIGMPGMISE
jgi:hypothetical protein